LSGRQRRRVALLATGAASLAIMSYLAWTLKLWNSLI
jgi:hypothetical protein